MAVKVSYSKKEKNTPSFSWVDLRPVQRSSSVAVTDVWQNGFPHYISKTPGGKHQGAFILKFPSVRLFLLFVGTVGYGGGSLQHSSYPVVSVLLLMCTLL